MKKLVIKSVLISSISFVLFLKNGLNFEKYIYDSRYVPSIHIDILDKNINMPHNKVFMYPLLAINYIPLLDVEFIPKGMNLSKRILPNDRTPIGKSLGYCILFDFMSKNITIPAKTDKYDFSNFTRSSRLSLINLSFSTSKSKFIDELNKLEELYKPYLVKSDKYINTIVELENNNYIYCYDYNEELKTAYGYNPLYPNKVVEIFKGITNNGEKVINKWEVNTKDGFKIYGDA